MKRAVIVLIAGIALAVLLSSCSEPPTLVTGKVEFSFDLSGARAIGYDITRVHVKLTHENGSVKETNLTVDESNDRAYGVIEGLRIGTWNILAELYENETEVGSGSTNIVIEAGKVTNVILRITLATGAASISVIWETASSQGGEQETEPDIIWQKSLGGSGDDRAYSIQQTSDGGYIVAGYTTSNDGDVSGNHGGKDFWVVKLDSGGNIVWQKTLGGSGDDEARSIQQTSDGGYIVAGWTFSNDGDVSGKHGWADYWVVKLDENGNIEWEKTLGGSKNDFAYSIQQTSDGGYIVVGHTLSSDGDVIGHISGWDIWLVKLDKDGNILWQKIFSSTDYDYGYSVQQTTDDGYIVAGRLWPYAWVGKFDNTGKYIWGKRHFDESKHGATAYAVQQTEDGGYIVAGRALSNQTDEHGYHPSDFLVVKFDSKGNIIWKKTYGGTSYEEAYSIQQTTNGGYIVAGYTKSEDGDICMKHGGTDAWIVKLDKDGNIVWQKALGGSRNDEAYSVRQTSDGGYVVSGYTFSDDWDAVGNHGKADFWVVKLGW